MKNHSTFVTNIAVNVFKSCCLISTIKDLWYIDALIPSKNRLLIELIREAVLWREIELILTFKDVSV